MSKIEEKLADKAEPIIKIPIVDDDCDNETREDDEPYFVDGNQGNDSNPGTEDCPFATISKAAESITDGDTVIISHGIYRESIAIEGINKVTFKAAD